MSTVKLVVPVEQCVHSWKLPNEYGGTVCAWCGVLMEDLLDPTYEDPRFELLAAALTAAVARNAVRRAVR